VKTIPWILFTVGIGTIFVHLALTDDTRSMNPEVVLCGIVLLLGGRFIEYLFG
jgi:hypothetical protein